jgi:sugar phosphate isomerase/epimerase
MNRRSFLFTAASAAAAGALESPASAANHAMQFHLSCGAIGVKANQEQAIDYAAKFGFDCVDADGRFLSSLNDEALGRLLEGMQQKKVGWALAGLPVEFRKDDETFAKGVTDLPAYAQGLRRAHVERVTTWVLPMDANRTYMSNFRTHAQRLREVASILEANNMRFGLEYVGPRTMMVSQKYPFVHTMAEMQDLIAEIGRPNVGLVLDSWHWYCAGDTARDLLALKASDVVSVDLNDAPAGIPVDQQIDAKRELPAATGVIDVKTFLGSLKEIGYKGPVRAEPFNEAVRRMSPDDALKATMAAMQKAFAGIA